MSRSVILIIFGIAVAVCCGYCVFEWAQVSDVTVPEESNPLHERRQSITFILGEDKEEGNRYYEEALRYYSTNVTGKTDYLVTSCRSLLEVRNYLEEHHPENQLPWGLVNLVSHGNQWTGLSIKITPDSKRCTPSRLEEYVHSGKFIPLPKPVIDQQTEIFLRGCGVGNNDAFVNTVALAFGGDQNLPVIRASKLFEYYASNGEGPEAVSEHYLANAWYTAYRMDERPSDEIIVKALHEKYPDASVHWHTALHAATPEYVGAAYHYTFEVPVRFVIPVAADSFPSLSSKDAQLRWLSAQEKITTAIGKLGLSPDQFKWSMSKVYLNNDDGTTADAVHVQGFCTILCVLQAMTADYDEKLALRRPMKVDNNDAAYFYRN